MTLTRRFSIDILVMFSLGLVATGCASFRGGSTGSPSLAPPMIGAKSTPKRSLLARSAPQRSVSLKPKAYQTVSAEGEPLLLPIPADADSMPGMEMSEPLMVEGSAVTAPLIIGDPAGQIVVDESVGCAGGVCKRPSMLHRLRAGRRPIRLPRPFRREVRTDIASASTRFPRELRLAVHPTYVVEPPDVLYIEADIPVGGEFSDPPLAGERLVRQDGSISLGYYGDLQVAGHTLAEIEELVRRQLIDAGLRDPQVYVDVAAYNSKVYYVLGQVEQTGQLPVTGKETVLDALTIAGGVTRYARLADIHVARPNPGGGCDQILHVDYHAITSCGDTRTNYQLVPGDRVVVPGTTGYNLGVVVD